MNATMSVSGYYMPRKPVPERRHTWRQKVTIIDHDSGRPEAFYIEFGEYDDGRLAEIWITAHRCGDSFTRGMMDSLAKSASLALQSGTSPRELAKTLRGQNYPPCGKVQAPSSSVTECSSLADYIAQEILACYGDDGRQVLGSDSGIPVSVPEVPKGKTAGHIEPEPPGASN